MKIKNPVLLGAIALLLGIFVIVLIVGLSQKKAVINTDYSTEDEAFTLATSAPVTEPEIDNSVTLSFIGDCILGSESGRMREGNFTWYTENYPAEYFFSEVYEVLSQDDFTLANVECVITDRQLEKRGKDYSPAFWFTTKTKNTEILTKGSVEFASVVNNHTYDYGTSGYNDTVAALKNAGLIVGEDYTPVYFEKNGIKVGVVCSNLWGYYQTSYIENALKQMQDTCDYRIVFFHGGEEGVHSPDNYKIDSCRELANSGLCDLIIGSHPHVLQPLEVVNDVPILYSLGNFCFSANNYPENKTVIFQVELTRQPDGRITTATNPIPCYVYTGSQNNWQPDIVEDEAHKNAILQMINTPVDYQRTTQSTEPEATEAPVPEPSEAPAPTTSTEASEQTAPTQVQPVESEPISEETIPTATSFY